MMERRMYSLHRNGIQDPHHLVSMDGLEWNITTLPNEKWLVDERRLYAATYKGSILNQSICTVRTST